MDLGVPEHLIKPDGWVPISHEIRQGLKIAAKIAKDTLTKEEVTA